MIRATVLQQVRKMRFEEVYARQARRERGRDRGARIAPALVPPDVKSPPDRGQAPPCGASPHWATGSGMVGLSVGRLLKPQLQTAAQPS
jgi:hypothetical protein